ncbi:MAG: hypothetical protein COU46_01455 [Candidatus Niyogibacteria bacterium CG10_big_fil_rev_8_21_14_0_10_42_19]|uniref:GIY-YIG domain-containing protein n=1 Tax=Candidatus Niyogibacteria bacterium CG10_big_fil_rev_8_21_14_0_10_42_19 TaxID=1974725 RepID=A0A2H0TFW9_9BACT|nr:MAG: hypothetical protein COU46_01455 [Candidatus Niyogibacteria bacterium CG10_big_fil_rev_8_21_14_0_10_42_19]
MFYVYVLKGSSNPKYYIGFTTDLKKRFSEHNAGENISTRRGKPWVLLYFEAYDKEVYARNRERMLKQRGKAWQELKKRVGEIVLKKVLG